MTASQCTATSWLCDYVIVIIYILLISTFIGNFGDTNMAGVVADEGGNISDYETCDVSDFYISDMIFTSLPFGNAFDDDVGENKCQSDYESSEPSVFPASEQSMALTALEDDVKVGCTSDVTSYEKATVERESGSLYSAISQIRSCDQESDVKTKLDMAECYDPQSFIKNLPELSVVESNDHPSLIPKQSPRRKSVTLALDLDGKKEKPS